MVIQQKTKVHKKPGLNKEIRRDRDLINAATQIYQTTTYIIGYKGNTDLLHRRCCTWSISRYRYCHISVVCCGRIPNSSLLPMCMFSAPPSVVRTSPDWAPVWDSSAVVLGDSVSLQCSVIRLNVLWELGTTFYASLLFCYTPFAAVIKWTFTLFTRPETKTRHPRRWDSEHH